MLANAKAAVRIQPGYFGLVPRGDIAILVGGCHPMYHELTRVARKSRTLTHKP